MGERTGAGVGVGISDGVGSGAVLGAGGDVGTEISAGLTQPATIATRTIRQRSRCNILECRTIVRLQPSANAS